MSVLEAVNVALATIGFVGVGWLVWFARRPDHDREAEEAARTYFDTHGRWPDDEPS